MHWRFKHNDQGTSRDKRYMVVFATTACSAEELNTRMLLQYLMDTETAEVPQQPECV